jgi:hypothetical protein
VTSASRKRFTFFIEIMPLAFFGLAGVVSPRLTYAVQSLVLSHALRVHVGIMPGPIDSMLTLVVICLLPLLVFYCWRASRCLAEARADREFATPSVLYLGTVATVFTPAWLPPLVDVFGRAAVLFGFIWWFASLLSFLAFVLAVAQIEAERSGERPRTLVLEALYHLGGAAGVLGARRLVRGSEIGAELAKKPPAAAVFLAAVIILAVLQGML